MRSRNPIEQRPGNVRPLSRCTHGSGLLTLHTRTAIRSVRRCAVIGMSYTRSREHSNTHTNSMVASPVLSPKQNHSLGWAAATRVPASLTLASPVVSSQTSRATQSMTHRACMVSRVKRRTAARRASVNLVATSVDADVILLDGAVAELVREHLLRVDAHRLL
jgi:hypothetical protein